MKKILTILSACTGIFFLILFTLPFFFRGKITTLIEKQVATYLDARPDIGKMELSMLKNFPFLQVKIKDVVLHGRGEFAKDTVILLPSLTASINVLSLVKGREVNIRQIHLKDARLYATVSADGNNSWNVLFPKESLQKEEKTKTTSVPRKDREKQLLFHDLCIENLTFHYTNLLSSTEILIPKIDFQLNGNLNAMQTTLQVRFLAQDAFYRQQNTVWFSQWDLQWEAVLDAQLDECSFRIEKNKLKINDLELSPKGEATFGGKHTWFDLSLSTPVSPLKYLLDLVPRKYKDRIEELQTDGHFQLTANCKGEYSASHFPAFDLKFIIEKGRLQHIGNSESIQQIDMSLNIVHPGGTTDSTTINLSRLSFNTGNQPFGITLQISDLQDPLLKGSAKGTLDLAILSKVCPIPNHTLEGRATTDLHFSGRFRQLEQKNYENFATQGEIRLKDIVYADPTLPKGFRIPDGQLRITPARVTLEHLRVRTDSSDFLLKGYISDYFPYFFKGGTLKGNFNLFSERLQLNYLRQVVPAPQDTTSGSKKTISNNPLLVPRNLKLQLITDLRNVTAGDLYIRKLKGQIILSYPAITLKDLQMELLGGNMLINGKYYTEKYKFPHLDTHIQTSGLDLQEVSKAFPLVRNTLPLATNCEGKISSSFRLSSDLGMDMKIRANTLNGEGNIASDGLVIHENPSLEKLAEFLQNEELNRLAISTLKINFKIENGNITISPFTTKLAGNPVTMYGRQTVSGKLDYTISLNVDRKYFGKDITNLLQAIPGSANIQNLDIDARITGDLNRPEIKTDLSKAIEKVRKTAEKDLKRKALKGLEKLFK